MSWANGEEVGEGALSGKDWARAVRCNAEATVFGSCDIQLWRAVQGSCPFQRA